MAYGSGAYQHGSGAYGTNTSISICSLSDFMLAVRTGRSGWMLERLQLTRVGCCTSARYTQQQYSQRSLFLFFAATLLLGLGPSDLAIEDGHGRGRRLLCEQAHGSIKEHCYTKQRTRGYQIGQRGLLLSLVMISMISSLPCRLAALTLWRASSWRRAHISCWTLFFSCASMWLFYVSLRIH